jgi:hypothetical protein
MPQELGNILLNTTILNKVEVSGVIADTINKVENLVAEAVSTAWKAGGSQPASAFSSNTLLTEANEGKVYNLSDALTITDQNKQYFTENAAGTYPAGTNVAVIQTTPPVYAAASGTAVSGTKYYSKMGNFYTEVPVPAGESVEGLYIRTSQPVYKYDVLAGTDAANVKQINVGSSAYPYYPQNGVITIPIASGVEGSTKVDGFMSSGQATKLDEIESGANVGFNDIFTDSSSDVVASSDDTAMAISGEGGIYTYSGSSNHSLPTVVIKAKEATESSPGVVTLASSNTYEWSTSAAGVATASDVVYYVENYVSDYNNSLGRFDELTVNYADPNHPGQTTSSSLSTSGGNTLAVTLGENMTASNFYDGHDDTDRLVTIDAIVPVKKVKVAGSANSISPDASGRVTIPSGTTSARGVVKLYTSAYGSNTDGAVTQKAVSGAIKGLRNFSKITVFSDPNGDTYSSGDLIPDSNASQLNVTLDRPLTVSSLSSYEVVIGVVNATSSAPGAMKLYPSANGTNKDGAVTQSGVKAIADSVTALRNYSQITAKYQKWNSGGTAVEWVSGSITPVTNSSTIAVYGVESVQVSSSSNTAIAISVARPDSEHGWPGVVTLEDAVESSSGANKGIAASPLMVTNSTATRVKKSITLSGLRQVSNDTQTPIPASINSTDIPNTLYGLIKALKFAANHAS